jgi:non-ribosomal peptide synthetase component E (peptide arylation enzyme)
MISLPALEEVLSKKYWSDDEIKIAVEALEKDWNVKIVLFSTYEINLEELNDYIHKNWMPNLVKFDEVQIIDQIPVLWTGKTDYKELKNRIEM